MRIFNLQPQLNKAKALQDSNARILLKAVYWSLIVQAISKVRKQEIYSQ
jgi:hypothetical protein